jgi:hypothetical protein
MKRVQQFLGFAGMMGILVALAGCTYHAAIQQLPPAERATFQAYSKVMTPAQVHTYVAKESAAARAAYLEEIGITQRFQALDPQDRETVLAGFPRKGMSAEALHFLWGPPSYTDTYPGHYEQWYYLGSSFSLAQYGNSLTELGTIVVVDLVNGQVDGWLETTDSDLENGGDEDRERGGSG